MPRLRAWSLTATMLLGVSTVSAQQFRARTDLVQLPVVVTDQDGMPVQGLTADDFEILEDGRPQAITAFYEGAPGRVLPLRLGLLLDTSESMERDLATAARNAVKFVDALEAATDVTFVDFSTAINVGRFQPPSYPQLFERIRSGDAGGGTALYDALGVYVQRALDRRGQHVVLLHTDGGDSTSSMTFGRLQTLLRLGNVTVYVVGYLQNQVSSDRMPQRMRISQIAHETGGEAFFPTSREEVEQVYDRIIAEISGRYTIGYQPAEQLDGTYRKVQVRLRRAELAGADVRTRAGYLAATPTAGGR